MVMKMGCGSLAAVEVVARTGYGEAVRVFDLGPRDETMNRGPGDRIAGRTCEGDCNHETGPLPTRSPGDQHGISISFDSRNRRSQKDAGGGDSASGGEQFEYTKRKLNTIHAEIVHLDAWLQAHDVSEVVMESTAQYW